MDRIDFWWNAFSWIPRARDPNELTGPAGYGSNNFVQTNNLLPYTIHFENETNATAPAQRVVLSNQLTNVLDWTTFELTEIAFGDHFIAVPPHTQHFEKTEKMSQDGYNFEVQIEAGIRLATGEVYARFQSLNPTNGLPPPVEIGMLPPENGTGRGQGHLSYVIRANTNLVTTGTEIRNVAYIVFDQNPPIGTDWVDPHNQAAGIDTNKQALVTIDADPPSGSVVGLPATAPNATFLVEWAGTDAGAGVAGYDVHVRTNGGPWAVWLANTPATSEWFQGENGREYCFYIVARDGADLVQAGEPVIACTQTMSNYPPLIQAMPDMYLNVGQLLIFTNTASDPDQPITFSLGGDAPAGAQIDAGSGAFVWQPVCLQGNTTNAITVWATDNGTPPMASSMTFSVLVSECVSPVLDTLVLAAGQTGTLPFRLTATTNFTQLATHLPLLASQFAPPSLEITNVAMICTNWVLDLTNLHLLVLEACGNQWIYTSNRVEQEGWLYLTAQPDQPSAIVPLTFTNIVGMMPDGTIVTSDATRAGRVVIIGEEPVLEAAGWTNGRPLLSLYGRTNWLWNLESTPDVTALNSWAPHAHLLHATTNLWQLVEPEGDLDQQRFFRARRVMP